MIKIFYFMRKYNSKYKLLKIGSQQLAITFLTQYHQKWYKC
jgi:hypothetical protein